MKIKLPGQEVHRIRSAFGMDVDAFAAVLAVHPTTVRRWEACGPADVPIDGIAANVLAVGRQRLLGTPPPNPDEMRNAGRDVVNTLAAAGALLALVVLINWLTARR